jgi:hypothetical protein
MVTVFREVWRVLRDDGTCWLNLGDSFNSIGHKKSSSGYGTSTLAGGEQKHTPLHRENTDPNLKHKDLCGIPWRVAFALQADGWYLRSDIIWSKPNPMPESVTDRPTKSHEYLFLLAKQPRYYYDAEAIKEPAQIHEGQAGRWERSGAVSEHVIPGQSAAQHRPNRKQDAVGKRQYTGFNERWDNSEQSTTRNRRSVWTVATAPFAGAHFATFPPALVEPCILAGTSARGCCSVCGAPWARVTETDNPRASDDYRQRKTTPKDEAANGLAGRGTPTSGLAKPGWRKDGVATTTTTGWQPACDHDAPTVPCIVLDPFAGSGTTGEVARLHGRRFVGLDLSAAYLRDLALPRAERKQTAASIATLPLFSGVTP